MITVILLLGESKLIQLGAGSKINLLRDSKYVFVYNFMHGKRLHCLTLGKGITGNFYFLLYRCTYLITFIP